MDRCIEGRLYRHKPFPHDPHFECDVGVCPDCQGRGCEQLERRKLFACRKCGVECASSPGVGQAVCETCCDDHDYAYARDRRGHFCKHCEAPRPHDWDSE